MEWSKVMMASMTCVEDRGVGRSDRSDVRRSQMDWHMWHEGGIIVEGYSRR